MTFTLAAIPLVVEEIGIASPQVVAWLHAPGAKALAQDWGPGLKTFALTGRFFRSEGALDQALTVDAIKEDRKPVIFRIGDNSWQVQCLDFRYRLRAGIVTYDLDVAELEPPTEYVRVADPEVTGVDVSAAYLAALRLKAHAFWWRGISDRIALWLEEATLAIADIQDYLIDAGRLTKLPAATLGAIRRAAAIVVSRMELIIAEIENQFTSSVRRYSDDEESLKQALLYARATKTRCALLTNAIDAIPAARTVATVHQGDTLIRLTERWNRDHETDIHWSDVARANAITDPGAIAPGDQLLIP